MPYTQNNPYIPGDPYSYDLKWLVTQVKANRAALDGLDDRIRNIVIRELDQHDPVYYETAQALIESPQKAGSIAYIEGYYAAGDGGANLYYVTDDYNDIIGANFYLTMAAPNLWALPIILTPYVTPEMFGAYGDGDTDDTAAVNISCKYGEILLTHDYYITDTIKLAEHSSIRSLKNSHIIRGASGFNLIELGGDNDVSVNIVGLGGASQISNLDREIYAATDSNNIHNCHIYEADYYGIYIDSSSDNLVENCLIDNYGYCAVCVFNDAANNIIKNNKIYNGLGNVSGNRYGIAVSGNTGISSAPADTIITGNILEDLTPLWEGIDAHGAYGINISDNIIKNFVSGIALNDRDGIALISKDIVINSNKISNNIDMDLVADTNSIRISTQTENPAVIANNIINKDAINSGVPNINNACLRIECCAIVNNNSITTTKASVGVRIASSASRPVADYILESNIINTPDIGVLLQNASGVDISGTGSNNTIINASVGIQGNATAGTGGYNRLCRNYYTKTTFINCTTNYTNVLRGLYFDAMPSLATAGAGLLGDVIASIYWNGSSEKTIHWICRSSSTAGTDATWQAVTTP